MTNCNLSMFEYYNQSTILQSKQDDVIVFYGKAIKKEKFLSLIDNFAGYLQNLGIQKGDNIVLCLGNIPNAIISFYAINKCGAIANVVHPLISSKNLERINNSMKPKAIIMFDEFLNKYSQWIYDVNKTVIVCSASDFLPIVAKQVYSLFKLKITGKIKYSSNIIKYSNIPYHKFCSRVVNGDDCALYMHSSGTTGEAKTAMLSNSAFNHLVESMLDLYAKEINSKDAMLMALPIFHTFGLGICMHTMLCASARILLMPKFDAKNACRIIKKHKCTFISGIPNMYAKIIDCGKFKGKYLKNLKSCYCGGDKLDPKIQEKFCKALKKQGSNLRISEGYGLTEACVCIVNKLDNYKQGSLGLPVKGNKVGIIDENGFFLEKGCKGELVLSSNSLMIGYFDDNKSESVFFVDKNGEKWLKTGDIAYIDNENFVFFVDRKKRLIKISGINIFPQEIENLVNKLYFVEKSCAVQTIINGKTAIKLFVACKNDIVLDDNKKNEIINDISENLIKYCMPSIIEGISAIPLTEIGKVDYKKLS